MTDSEEMVYGYHMSVHKTTIYLDLGDHRRITALAKAIGRPTAELIREAVADYLRRYAPGAEPSCLGAGRSGRPDLGERAEEFLAGLGEPQ